MESLKGTSHGPATTHSRTASAARSEKHDHIIAVQFDSHVVWIGEETAEGLIRALLDALASGGPSPKTPAEHRKALDMTQEEAASHLGIRRPYLSNIERGEAQQVSLRVVRKMAHLYGCGVEDLGIEIKPND